MSNLIKTVFIRLKIVFGQTEWMKSYFQSCYKTVFIRLKMVFVQKELCENVFWETSAVAFCRAPLLVDLGESKQQL